MAEKCHPLWDLRFFSVRNRKMWKPVILSNKPFPNKIHHFPSHSQKKIILQKKAFGKKIFLVPILENVPKWPQKRRLLKCYQSGFWWSGHSSRDWRTVPTKFQSRPNMFLKSSNWSDMSTFFAKCAQMAPKSTIKKLFSNLFLRVRALLPHLVDGANQF